ncbi:unnamed protein product [Paramecium sonneborni]|uniref:Uncharacterized protein n=1 Tax=Paramecium sonneborni TaxID=65129 RepID=A0A8S1NFK3_9CILI|nr:unnamed protein product [Paramecium sonneborni]
MNNYTIRQLIKNIFSGKDLEDVSLKDAQKNIVMKKQKRKQLKNHARNYNEESPKINFKLQYYFSNLHKSKVQELHVYCLKSIFQELDKICKFWNLI